MIHKQFGQAQREKIFVSVTRQADRIAFFVLVVVEHVFVIILQTKCEILADFLCVTNKKAKLWITGRTDIFQRCIFVKLCTCPEVYQQDPDK